MNDKNADIIIAGSGLAGLTLALNLADRPYFDRFRILLIDRDEKQKNDRTWCFWADQNERLPPVIFHQWQHARFYAPDTVLDLQMAPYRYYMVRGIDFYRFALEKLQSKANFTRVLTEIDKIEPETGRVHTRAGIFQAPLVFNSALQNSLNSGDGYTRLLQHFKGWLIETGEDRFDPDAMTFMDYRVSQEQDTRFVYVLPVGARTALVEYTVFSDALLPKEEYEREIEHYIRHDLGIPTYRILEKEFGVIPMTDRRVHAREHRVIHIGTAGGFVKGSSGYAFLRTQRKIRAFVEQWERSGNPNAALFASPWRFRFYDSVMLRVLRDRLFPGAGFFTRLFVKLPASLVFRFLDEDSTFAEDIRLLGAPPVRPFLKAAFRQIPALFRI